MGIVVGEDCSIYFYRLNEAGLNISQYSDPMLKALHKATLHEKVTEVTIFEKGPYSISSLVDEHTIVGISDSIVWNELNQKIVDNDHRFSTSPRTKVAVFICHKSASSRAFRQDGYCIAATASWLWLWLLARLMARLLFGVPDAI